ncbi:MAG: zinc ribbon domain-containing protein [Nitriliruptorales bacterium]
MTDTEPSPEELEALLRLQDLENAIRRLEHRLNELPEQAALDASSEASASVRQERDSCRVDLDLVEGEMRKLEGEIDLLQQRRSAEQERLYGGEITNPRELQAVRAEIESVDRRIEGFEERLLDVLERREELVTSIEALSEREKALQEEQADLTSARDEAAQGILAELAEHRVSADREREAIPADVLSEYDAKKQRHTGVGVGALRSGICTACRMELTALEINDLRNGPPLGHCPQCQRLIVVD